MSSMNPEVGMGITYGAGSDRYVGTIHKVSPDGKTFWFTDDHCKNTAVFPDQEWEMTPRPETDTDKMSMVKMVARGKKKGAWTIGGKADGTRVSVGVRNKYCDPHF